MYCCTELQPVPPNSFGQCDTPQPFLFRIRHHSIISFLPRCRPSCNFCRVDGGTWSLKKARTSSRNATSSLLKLRSIGSSCEANFRIENVSAKEARSLSLWERAGVRGYALSIGRNPSPGSLERSDLSRWER